MKRPAAFLDRDGVLNVRPRPHEYVRSVQGFHWIDGAAEGAARLARAGYVLAIVSNQRGVARGLVDPSALADIEVEIQAELGVYGAQIEAFRYCVHGSDAGCDCRKPAPGLLLSAARDLDLDLERSWMIGDSDSDVVAGHAAGCASALVRGTASDLPLTEPPELAAASLLAVSALILNLGRPKLPGHPSPMAG